MPQSPASSGYWLLQAADARQMAEGINDPGSKRAMLLMARGYERMAEHAASLERLSLPMETPRQLNDS
jgi:hypothetical protein